MPELVQVVFQSGGKVFSFDPAGLELSPGENVIVRTSRGVELGHIVVANHEMPAGKAAPSERVMRKATASDQETAERNDKLAARVAQVCEEKVQELGLDMRLINTEVVFDGSKIVISFFSEERVDFRKLVEDLAKKYRTRIEFRQVGVRDEARIIGGYGPCGRRMCCTMFAGDQQPVSIRMAKEQNLPLNPMKISGICGRLMCCLKYENRCYREFKQKAPSRGTMVSTSQGDGPIVDYVIPKEKVVVDIGEGHRIEAALDDLQRPSQKPPQAKPEPVAAKEKEKTPERPRGRGRQRKRKR
ncbi:MAG: PSP1 domain-containing protein [Thermoleophilia bacterium]